ncbi:hypothetical protein [Pseudoalteromonas umbrosa]|uniref:hypothetical protein n=1 Tax=Pseudoalteromonas umbrosa TaxID=3048489 RepID=UPI0024C2CE76|nr:hypothetical protein [Pseudoalteromonas sp. B95]MDK1290231.1 hypothetical protein [Pseudoalteromonas sp. B95]
MFYIDINKQTEKRYAPEKLIRFDTEGAVYDILDSHFLVELNKLPMAGTYVIVEDEGRPDVIAYKLFGSTEYWWIIMAYNNLLMPSQLVAGAAIKYPSMQRIETLYGKLAAQERHVNNKLIEANAPETRSLIGDPDSLGKVIPSGDGETNAMLLRAYASYAAQRFNLDYAVIDDFQTTEGINIERSKGLQHAPFRVDLTAGGTEAPILTTIEHRLLERTTANAIHVAMLPDTNNLNIEYSLDGGTRWEGFDGGVIFTKGSDTITLRFIYTPAQGDPMQRTFNGYVIVHN